MLWEKIESWRRESENSFRDGLRRFPAEPARPILGRRRHRRWAPLHAQRAAAPRKQTHHNSPLSAAPHTPSRHAFDSLSQEYDPSAALDAKAEARNPLRPRGEAQDAAAVPLNVEAVALQPHKLRSAKAFKALFEHYKQCLADDVDDFNEKGYGSGRKVGGKGRRRSSAAAAGEGGEAGGSTKKKTPSSAHRLRRAFALRLHDRLAASLLCATAGVMVNAADSNASNNSLLRFRQEEGEDEAQDGLGELGRGGGGGRGVSGASTARPAYLVEEEMKKTRRRQLEQRGAGGSRRLYRDNIHVAAAWGKDFCVVLLCRTKHRHKS